MFLRNSSFGIETWPSMNPLQRDMAFMNGNFITQSHVIMLLTLEEAEQVVDDLLGGVDKFFSYKAAPGNIKDGLDAFRNLSKLTTWYNPAQELVFNFKALKIKAIEYNVGGKSYIKITGHAGLRRILTGTRYGASHPQMLEMAIGQRGMSYSIINGTKYCIYFSLAWRAVELIFKSDYHLVDFLVDITMDTAKIVVSSVVIGVVGGILTLLSAPVVATIVILVLIGLGLNSGLNYLDDQFSLSATLKAKIREFYHLHGVGTFNNTYELQYLF
ncbi:hypothetical protein QMG90_01230 [Trabulsiella odontotermitis]|uniref:hypothetical protein n=1 Tax=Trabulsiella odontotermitis TaxID=379893 RepID=UPI0024B6A467|nr:hypothetical protein [Trabulsiella odontotermitis]WHP31602.1 hypothetical protein QMG90_01230 [Trabulsiella odontotermitis]